MVWGIVGVRGYPLGEHVASNGVEFDPLFSLDLDFNLMLWRQENLYFFSDSSFYGQKAAPGITNPSQGSFDFSKRELDLTLGLAWNYYGYLEARAFTYSFNNLNRGNNPIAPSGFNDGTALENRLYLARTYADLGTAAYDPARASFVSIGYYPSKSMVDATGTQFKPGMFARAYLIADLWTERFYAFGDAQFISDRSFQATLLNLDAGLALRPFTSVPRLEFRVGTQDIFDLHNSDGEISVYGAVRYVY